MKCRALFTRLGSFAIPLEQIVSIGGINFNFKMKGNNNE